MKKTLQCNRLGKIQIVSPFAKGRPTEEDGGRVAGTYITFCYSGQTTYQIPEIVASLDLLRKTDETLRLTVCFYGPRAPSEDALRTLCTNQDQWISICDNLDEEAVDEHLRTCETLVRLTKSDGDSLVVRRALELGCAVIASDVVPRPSGVILCEANETGLRAALTGPNKTISDGDGLGTDLAIAIVNFINSPRTANSC